MRLRFTPRAVANIVEMADFIDQHNATAGLRVRSAIYESLRNLTQFPQIGRRQKAEGLRKFVTGRYGYLV